MGRLIIRVIYQLMAGMSYPARIDSGIAVRDGHGRNAKYRSPRRHVVVALAWCLALPFPALAHVPPPRPAKVDPIQIIRAVMEIPDDKIDFARAKLTFDKLYDPKTDIDGGVRKVDAMAQTIRTMAGPSAPSRLRLIMLRKYIYERGAWNDNNPYQYDLTDPLGHKPVNRLLSSYLATHRGNCVSMPILFVALAQRLGLNATLSTAPNHVFVKYMDDVTGKTINLETTSGAYPTRDIWIRKNMPMTDRAIANGIYMKTLSKKEALVVLAGIVMEREFADERYQEAWDIAELLRSYHPNDLAVLLTPANAAMALTEEEYLSKYPTKADIPPDRLDRLAFLERSVSNGLNHAYALGWRETDGEETPAVPAKASR